MFAIAASIGISVAVAYLVIVSGRAVLDAIHGLETRLFGPVQSAKAPEDPKQTDLEDFIK